MNCPACGAEVDPDANFCLKCGTQLSDGESGADAVPPQPPEEAPGPGDAEATTAMATAQAEDGDEATGEMPTASSTPTPDDTRALSADEGGLELRPCPNCGASNSPRRTLCGRCGADLETGELGEQAPTYAPGPTPEGARDPADHRATGEQRTRQRTGNTARTVVLVIGLGVLIGALVGAAIALGIGPFASDDDGIPGLPDFDEAAYGEEPQSLAVGGIGATSTHPPLGDQSFAATQMVDGELATAWNNDGGQNPGGTGEVIAVELTSPAWLSEIVLANGAQQSDQAFLGNGRVARARITLDGDQVFEVVLLDEVGRQSVVLDEPRLTTGLRIDVIEVFPGDTYEELAITEVAFRGFPAIGRDREIAEERAGGGAETTDAPTSTG